MTHATRTGGIGNQLATGRSPPRGSRGPQRPAPESEGLRPRGQALVGRDHVREHGARRRLLLANRGIALGGIVVEQDQPLRAGELANFAPSSNVVCPHPFFDAYSSGVYCAS